MSGVGLNQPSYNQSVNVPSQLPRQQSTQQSTPSVSSSIAGYAYADDVFTGQFQNFKDMYKGLDTSISKYSPFFGKMQPPPALSQQTQGLGQNNPQGNLGQAQTNIGFVDNANGTAPTQGRFVPPPSNPNGFNTQQNNTVNPNNTNPNGLPAITNQGTIAPAGNTSQPTAKVFPQKAIPSGPVVTNLQQQLQQEAQTIQTPQKAIESVAGHAMLSRQERTIANDVSWGARFYAQKANELAQKIVQSKGTMNPSQIQAKVREVENLKLKSISLLNEAKKHAINTYTEATKATLIYNNFFTENGQFASVINDNDRQFVESEIDKTWSNWTTGFDKQLNGQVVHADEAPTVIDKTNDEITVSMNKTNQILAALAGN
ncbi:MAG: hypothetical protein AABZ74_17060 [Cyanobacteriota bacterium]